MSAKEIKLSTVLLGVLLLKCECGWRCVALRLGKRNCDGSGCGRGVNFVTSTYQPTCNWFIVTIAPILLINVLSD